MSTWNTSIYTYDTMLIVSISDRHDPPDYEPSEEYDLRKYDPLQTIGSSVFLKFVSIKGFYRKITC